MHKNPIILMFNCQEVRQSLSAPDLDPMEERLAYLKRAVYRAFPSFRLVSSRDSYSYRRVRVPIDIFKVIYYRFMF
jgi:Cut8, nuclear proteasome tether protein